MSRSRRRLKASRRFASDGALPSVMIGSTTRRSSFAFGSVVLMTSCLQQRARHVAQHREPVAARAVELSKAVTVTHGLDYP